MTKNVRNSAMPTITWFGGLAWRPSACRISDRTITMRVKLVIRSSAAGRNDNAEKTSIVCTGTEYVVPPGPLAAFSVSSPCACAWANAGASSAATSAAASAQRPTARRAVRSGAIDMAWREAAQQVGKAGRRRGDRGDFGRRAVEFGEQRDGLRRDADHQPL